MWTGYAEIHSATRERGHFRPWQWLVRDFRRRFAVRSGVFWMAVALTVVGGILGAFLISKGVEGREAIYPFSIWCTCPPASVASE